MIYGAAAARPAIRYRSIRWIRRAFAGVREVRTEWHTASAEETVMRILSARFGDLPAEATAAEGAESEPTFDLASFQKDAVDAAERILSSRGGVLIADSVGLGKTYVALALVERALRKGSRVAVVTPATLRREWKAPLQRVTRAAAKMRAARIRASSYAALGRPPRLLRPVWISHTRLSRGGHSPERIGHLDLVVVDEAHAFRNPRTRRYRALAELCRGARVVLLTATPVNNTLTDLYVQLRLFAGDAAFRDLGVPDLATTFRLAAADGDGIAAAALDTVLRAVVIRRTRPFLRRHYGTLRVPGRRGGSIAALPRRAPPVPVRYTLDDLRPGFHADVVDCLSGLTLAPFRLGEYGMPFAQGRGGEAELIRLSLLKRLESSVAAFALSMRRQLRFYRAFLDALEAARLLTPTDHGALHGAVGDADVVQLIMHEVALREAPRGLDAERLRADARTDLELLRTMLAGLDEPLATIDPKLRRLRDMLDQQIGDRKAILFTEFRDTARHLWRALRSAGGVGLVDGDGAFLGASPAGRRAVIERFAPRSNGAREPTRRERVDLLIATDVLAEGLNLQDADTVISYDLPWNPVRLMQRVGRIDRLGSPFSTIRSYHFLPDQELERVLKLVSRLRTKLGAISRSVGAEAPVLTKAEIGAQEFDAFVDRLAAGDPDVLEGEGWAGRPSLEIGEQLRTAYLTRVRRGANHGPDAADRALGRGDSAPAAVMPAPVGDPHRVILVYGIRGRAHSFLFDVENGTVGEDAELVDRLLLRALDITERPVVERSPGVAPLPLCVGAPLRRTIDRAFAAAEDAVALREAVIRAADPVHVQSPGARLAGRLLAALNAMPGGPDPSLCRRCDRLLSDLSRSHAAGTDARLRDLLNGEVGRSPDSLIAAIEHALDLSPMRPASPNDDDHPGASLLGILELRPDAR